MMLDSIRNFPRQFLFAPRIENAQRLKRAGKFAILGMGGSNLTAGLLKIGDPSLDIVAHKDYGLPSSQKGELRERLIIAVSHSGNTEETLDGFDKARKRRLPLAAVGTGGKLIEAAGKQGIPYIRIPNDGIQPRMSLGYMSKALLALMGRAGAVRQVSGLANTLKIDSLERNGRTLAAKLRRRIPVIYVSGCNQALAYAWKVKFNETAKIPAFYNVFPELNHNEMTGFDVALRTKALSRNFHFIFLADRRDHPRVQKRMKICIALYKKRGFKVEIVPMQDYSRWHTLFSSLLVADFAAYYLAQTYRVEPEQVPMVEEFKRMMR